MSVISHPLIELVDDQSPTPILIFNTVNLINAFVAREGDNLVLAAEYIGENYVHHIISDKQCKQLVSFIHDHQMGMRLTNMGG